MAKPVQARPVVLLALPSGDYQAKRKGGDRHTLRPRAGKWVCDCLGYWYRGKCAHADAANIAFED